MAVKAQSQITADIFGSTLTLTFANGRDLSVNVETLNAEIAKQAMLHGLKQKLVDAAAIARNTDTGRAASIEDKFSAVKEVFDRITGANPTWNKARGEGNGPSGSRNLLVRAIMEVKGVAREKAELFVEARSKEELAALRKNPVIAMAIARMQTADSSIDTDTLLGELSDDTEVIDADDLTDDDTDESDDEPEIEEQPVKKGRGRARVTAE